MNKFCLDVTPPCSLGVGEFLFVYFGKPFMHLRVHKGEISTVAMMIWYSMKTEVSCRINERWNKHIIHWNLQSPSILWLLGPSPDHDLHNQCLPIISMSCHRSPVCLVRLDFFLFRAFGWGFETVYFYGMGSSTPCPTSNLEDQVICNQGFLPLAFEIQLHLLQGSSSLFWSAPSILFPWYLPYLVSIPLSATWGGTRWETSNSSRESTKLYMLFRKWNSPRTVKRIHNCTYITNWKRLMLTSTNTDYGLLALSLIKIAI